MESDRATKEDNSIQKKQKNERINLLTDFVFYLFLILIRWLYGSKSRL